MHCMVRSMTSLMILMTKRPPFVSEKSGRCCTESDALITLTTSSQRNELLVRSYAVSTCERLPWSSEHLYEPYGAAARPACTFCVQGSCARGPCARHCQNSFSRESLYSIETWRRFAATSYGGSLKKRLETGNQFQLWIGCADLTCVSHSRPVRLSRIVIACWVVRYWFCVWRSSLLPCNLKHASRRRSAF